MRMRMMTAIEGGDGWVRPTPSRMGGNSFEDNRVMY
jgi:hypothetical protein